MKLLALLGKCALVAVTAIVVLTVYGKVKQRSAANPAPAASSAKDPGLSEAGFFLLKREEASNPRVTIMSPPNCPSHEAQRARDLEASLQAAGVPCEMKNSIEFTFTDPADAERVQQYMASVANPLVLVRGWAKGNPTAEDIVAQYRAQ
jgi:hypothetical protein